ncbi:MAG: methyltransferase domain-containing protein [Thaumarchaeota archaeon]|nr:methyltransferase domain-containing protein [Nitrososphaerota archaeon]
MVALFDPTEYKINSKANWNAVAPDYHYNWANKHAGPFKSTVEVVNLAEINPSDKVLDIACGTGAVSTEIFRRLDKTGLLVGIDLSRTALHIAKKTMSLPNANFFEMDAENLGFNFVFDKILCQYGLMFFPNVNKVLETARKILKHNGRIVFAVHGLAEDVPYFSSIMSPILKYIPDIRPKGVPTVHRFGNTGDLQKELERAGFSNVSITKHVFSYEAGTFEEYWHDYMHSTANSIRPKIESMGENIRSQIKHDSLQNTVRYTKDGKITFPWTVLTALAHNT